MKSDDREPVIASALEVFLTFGMFMLGATTLTLLLMGGLWLVERIFTR